MAIVGTVHLIEGRRKTSKIVDAKVAFSDPEQAKLQILYGPKEQLKLARAAYRQFQGKRFRLDYQVPAKRKRKAVKRLAE
jgi:hypothetical protein